MAEAIFRARAGEALAWDAASAGLMALGGQAASGEAVEALREIGLDGQGHRSQGVTQELVADAALVVGMAQHHVEELRRRFPWAADKIRLLKSYGPAGAQGDILDPIGQSLFVYRKIRDEIESAVSDLILDLMEHDRA